MLIDDHLDVQFLRKFKADQQICGKILIKYDFLKINSCFFEHGHLKEVLFPSKKHGGCTDLCIDLQSLDIFI